MPRKNNHNSTLKDINQDHEWLCTQNLGHFAGEWIAVYARAIIAHDIDLKALMSKVKSIDLPKKPLLVHVPGNPVVV
jgi:hypothetical protein